MPPPTPPPAAAPTVEPCEAAAEAAAGPAEGAEPPPLPPLPLPPLPLPPLPLPLPLPPPAWAGSFTHARLGTSTMDLARTSPEAPHGHSWRLDHQTQGRGRRGRSWASDGHQGVWMTTLLRPRRLADLSTLSLVAGCSLLAVVQRAGADGAALKWPNDIWVEGRKLAGILLEAETRTGPETKIWVGIGLNLESPPADLDGVGLLDVLTPAAAPSPQPAVDLRPQPAIDPRPQPAVDPRPQPAIDLRPQPAVDLRPQLAIDLRPQLAVDPRPQLAIDLRPQPAVDPRPQLAVDLRPQLAAAISAQLGADVATWHHAGLAAVAGRLAAHDALAGREVRVTPGGGAPPWCGRAAGIDADGRLRVETTSGTRLVVAGEVERLRPA